MLSKTLDAAVQKIGLTVTTDHAYGIYGGYLLTVNESGSKKTAFFNFLLDENEDNSLAAYEISEAIKSNLETYSILDYELQDDGLSVTTSQSVSVFLEMIDFFTELLNQHKVIGSEYCSCCGKKFGNRFPKKLTRKNKNYLLCESCTLEVIEGQDKPGEAERGNESKKKKLYAVIASVIGGLLGVFLYFASYKWLLPAVDLDTWDLRYVLAALGFVLSFFAYAGYKLVVKKATLCAYISVPLIAIFSSLAGQYIGTIIKILSDASVKFSQITDYSRLFLMPLRSTATEGFAGYSTDFYIFSVISVVLAAAGSVIFLIGFYEQGRVVKEVPKIETLKIKSK